MNAQELIKDWKYVEDWQGDPWGAAMLIKFDICAELEARGDGVPPEYEYRSGISPDPRDPDGYWYDALQEMRAEDLLRVLKVMDRYTTRLRRAGRDY